MPDGRFLNLFGWGCCGGGTSGRIDVTLPTCFCAPTPESIFMTSADEGCNYGMFRTGTLAYGPTPPEYASLDLGANCYLGTESWPDAVAGDALFRYVLTCQFNQFTLTRVYASSPYGSPFRDGILYTWNVGGGGNTCTPFHLDNGVPYPGSDPSCSVALDG